MDGRIVVYKEEASLSTSSDDGTMSDPSKSHKLEVGFNLKVVLNGVVIALEYASLPPLPSTFSSSIRLSLSLSPSLFSDGCVDGITVVVDEEWADQILPLK
jgi:hypothetical protein